MKVGFTGTSKGMTDNQILMVAKYLQAFKIGSEFHHGDCIGADSEAHDIARLLKYRIISHPPINSIKRAFKDADVVLEPKKYMVRNQDIAKVCNILIATPESADEVLRSGTWSTVRKARKLNKEVIIIAPDKNKAA